MPRPTSMQNSPDLDWKKVKRRLAGVCQQLQVQADLIEDTRQAYCDVNGKPFENCTAFVSSLTILLESISLFQGVTEDAINHLIQGDG